MKTLLLILSLAIFMSCSQESEMNSSSSMNTSSVESSMSDGSEPPCDDVEAPKVEVTETGINLLEEDEGCKLEE